MVDTVQGKSIPLVQGDSNLILLDAGNTKTVKTQRQEKQANNNVNIQGINYWSKCGLIVDTFIAKLFFHFHGGLYV